LNDAGRKHPPFLHIGEQRIDVIALRERSGENIGCRYCILNGEIDANAANIRRSGQDPEAIKAQVRASLKSVEAIDVEAIARKAMASVDPAKIAASVAAAQASVAQAQAEIDRIEVHLDDAD
jgi:hypothetical protein